jgi:hypothetical protein
MYNVCSGFNVYMSLPVLAVDKEDMFNPL